MIKSIEEGLAIVTKDHVALCGKTLCRKGDKVTVITGLKDAYDEVEVTTCKNKDIWVPLNNLLHIDIINKKD